MPNKTENLVVAHHTPIRLAVIRDEPESKIDLLHVTLVQEGAPELQTPAVLLRCWDIDQQTLRPRIDEMYLSAPEAATLITELIKRFPRLAGPPSEASFEDGEAKVS